MKAAFALFQAVVALAGMSLTASGDATLRATCAPVEAALEQGWETAAVESLSVGYAGATDIWVGFDPGEHPAIVVCKSGDGEVGSVLAINFPAPKRLGIARELDSTGTVFESLHLVQDLDPAVENGLESVESFEFSIQLGGVDAFAIVARKDDPSLDPATLDWTSYFIHELFHRHQDRTFTGPFGDQDVENYPVTAETIAMAALEARALRAALEAGSQTDREVAARHFAALRMARLLEDGRVGLDNEQERVEGSARYVEHRLAGNDTRFWYNGGNYHVDLFGDPDSLLEQGIRVRDYHAFDRFYATGAAILRTLDLLGVRDADLAVQNGMSPAEVLMDHLFVSPADVTGLVSEARAAYDPDSELSSVSRRAAASIDWEIPVFADGEESRDEQGVPISRAQESCLAENGVSEDATFIPDEVFERCFGSPAQ